MYLFSVYEMRLSAYVFNEQMHDDDDDDDDMMMLTVQSVVEMFWVAYSKTEYKYGYRVLDPCLVVVG